MRLRVIVLAAVNHRFKLSKQQRRPENVRGDWRWQ
jgi:hypothetical protein